MGYLVGKVWIYISGWGGGGDIWTSVGMLGGLTPHFEAGLIFSTPPPPKTRIFLTPVFQRIKILTSIFDPPSCHPYNNITKVEVECDLFIHF